MFTGIIKEEVMSPIFAHYFPHPNDLEELLNNKIKQISDSYQTTITPTVKTGLFDKILKHSIEYNFLDSSICETKDIHTLKKSEFRDDFPFAEDIFEALDAISDLRKALELKAVAQRSRAGVSACLQDMLTLERICDNLDFYENQIESFIKEIGE